jgi:hypothetical protein
MAGLGDHSVTVCCVALRSSRTAGQNALLDSDRLNVRCYRNGDGRLTALTVR